MENVRTICFAAVVLLLCACPALGLIEFKDGLTHDIDYAINDHVRVDYQTPAMYTTVNWLDGGSIPRPYYLEGYEHSRINVRGGYIGYNLISHDFSQLNMSGGSIDCVFAWNNSQVDISGGSIDSWLQTSYSSRVDISGGSMSSVYSYHSSQVDISGGSMGHLWSWDSSQVDISGGSMGYLHSFDSSQVNISGGSMSRLFSDDSSQVNISGGSIGYNLLLYDQSKIQIFGSDFAVDGQPFGYGELTSILGGYHWDEPWRRLTGTLLSGELIDNDFRIGEDAKIVLVPEPTTLLLLGLGGLILRKRRR